MLQCCVCLSSSVCDVCIVAKRCVLEQNLLLRAYSKSYNYEELIGTKINNLDLCLYVESRSTTAFHTTFIISETVRDRGLVPKDHHQ